MLALLNFQHFVSTSGYAAIFVLSVLQSCCIPTSSELTLGFAGVLAGEGKLSLAGIIIVGVAGEVLGAYIAYFVGRYAGRAFVDRYGRYILLTHHDLDRAEAWYQRHERWGVLGSRLIPVIRNFVAVPAGVAEVPLVQFGILTAIGSAIWLGAWAGIGYALSGEWRSIAHAFSFAGYLLAAAVVIAIAFVIYHRYRSYKAATAGQRTQYRAGDRMAGRASSPVSYGAGGAEGTAAGSVEGTGADAGAGTTPPRRGGGAHSARSRRGSGR